MNFIQEIDNCLVEISWFLDGLTTCQKQDTTTQQMDCRIPKKSHHEACMMENVK